MSVTLFYKYNVFLGSNNINEVIKAVLNFFIFLHTQKALKSTKSTKWYKDTRAEVQKQK